jgi:Mrp family chromosome partitioning ATPase
LADEPETGDGSLVLTDTSPLAVSAETEYLARLVDCAIIVIESGVTTRAQLREVARSLQKLDVAAVGFVLNRVKLQKADPAFRRSIRGVEQHLRTQSRSFKQELENIQKQKKLQGPDAYVFYVSEWQAANPDGDVDAAVAEAKRLGYEVVKQ